MKRAMKRSSSFLRVPITALVVALAACAATASAATLTWDADGTTTGTATDGAGTWLGTGQWWDGAANVTWTSGDDAVFGVGGTGGAVTLSAPTTAGSLTFNGFTGTYTLGTSGQTLTLGGGGIAMNAGAGAVTLSSPVTLGTAQSWTNNSSSLLTASAAITNGGFGLTVAGSGNTTLSGIVSGTGSLTKTGAGTLTLGNVQNTFTGGTIVNGGTLTLGTGLQNGNIRGSLTINAGATVNANAGNWSLGYGGTRSGATYGGISVTDIAINGGLLNFTNGLSGAGLAANSIVLTGGTIGGTSFGWINSNTLTPTLQTLASSTRSTLSGGISLRLSGSGALTFDVASGSTSDGTDLAVGPITDATAVSDNAGGRVIKTGSGRMVFTGSNTFTGGLTLSAGQLDLNHASALGTGTFTITGGSIGNSSGAAITLSTNNAQVWNADVAFAGPSSLNLGTGAVSMGASRTVTVSSGTLTVGGAIAGAGFNLTKAGTGTLVLGAAGYTGNTTVNAGTLQIGAGSTTGTLSTSAAISGSAGATLAFARSNTVTQGTDFPAVLSGPLNVSQAGAGTLVLNGANTFTGTTRIVAGTLSLGNTLAIQNSTLDMNAADAGTIVFGLSGTNTYAIGGLVGSRNIAMPDGVILGVGGNGTSGTYSGVLSGSGSLTKAGAGTLTLTGVNSYTGGTVVDSGTLTLGTAGFDGVIRGSLTINAGDTVNASQNWSLGAGGTNSSQPTSRSVTDVTINGGTLNFTTNSTKGGMSPTTLTMTGGSITGDDFQWYYGNSSSVSLVTQASATTSTVTPGLVLRLNKTAGVGVLTLNVASGAAPGGVDLLISGQIRNATEEGAGGRLVKTGAGTLVLSGNNTFTDGLTLSAGQVNVNSATALGTGGFTIAGGTIGNSSGTAVTLSTNNTQAWNADVTFVGPSSLNLGTGGVTLGGSRTVTVTAGSLTVGGGIATGSNMLTVTGSGNTTLSGVISGSGGLVKTGAGTLTLRGSNTFTGGVVLTGGTLALQGINGSAGAIQSNQNISITNAALTTIGTQFNALSQTWTSGTITINAGGLLSAGNTSSNAHNLFDVVLAGGTMAAGTGSLNGALANWYVNGGITATGSTTSVISASLGKVAASSALAVSVDAGSALTVSGPIVNIGGANGLTKTGAGLLTLSATNTYTGATTVSAGTLALSGGWNGTLGQVTVANVVGTNATLTIQSGSYGFGGNSLSVGNVATSVGIANQTGGAVTFTGGNQLLVGTGSGGVGAYTLAGGTITTATSTLVGVMLGVNPNASGTFTMTGGALNMTAATGGGGDATLLIGRFGSAGENGQSGAFIQSGGVASVGILSIGGTGSTQGTGGTQVLTLTGGTFAANQFPRLSAGNSNVATITIGGSADVTLPAFPTARGSGATATVYFDGGILRPAAASAAYMSGLTNAFIRLGGITLDVPSGRDITIGQTLLADGTSPGGGLVKTGAGTLTLGNVTNTYSGGTIVNGGVLTLGSGGANGNIRGSLTINQGATVNASASNWSLGYGGTRSGATYSGTSVTSISINGGLLNFTNGYSGAGVAANSIILNGGTIGGSFGWINTNTLTPTLQTLASSARSTLSGGISLRLSTSGTLTFDVASGSTPDGIDLFVGPITSSTISPDNNGGSLIKTGAGTMVLSGSNTYTGATSITGGRLRVDSTGSINSTSGITINGGDLRYNAATALTRPITFTAGTISGTGSIGTAVTAAAGDILSPGNSPGAQAYTAGLTWSGSGSYLWELNALSGTSGVNWDVINVSGGTFNLSGLSAGSRFILDLTTLTGSNTAGGLDLPYDGGIYAFLIASYTSLSTPLGTAAGTDLTSLFDLRLTNWAAPKPLPENLSVRINGTANGIELIVVPEPAALALSSLGAATAGWVIWRRRRRGRGIAERPTAD